MAANWQVPVVGSRDSSRQNLPVANRPKDYANRWAFSFKYFNQIDNFGLDAPKVKISWFVSLLERFRDLSKTELEMFFGNVALKDNWRYHRIDWESRNVPIKRSDLNWIDKHILDNEEEFPMWQFMISKANGRVVGFWNEDNSIFHVVLLDPMHNIQPSSYNNYKVDDCYPLSCNYSSLLLDIQNSKCRNPDCQCCNKMSSLPTKANEKNIIYAFIDDDFLNQLQNFSLTNVLEAGIVALT
jgi:hypothetical protein